MLLSDADIAGLRQVHESALFDTCVLVTIDTTYDDYGAPVVVETESAPKPCHFIPQMSFSTRAQEYVDASGTVLRIGAAVQLKISEYENVTTLDRIKITHIFGKALPTPLTFDVMGKPQRGTVFIHVGLQDVSR